MNGMLTGDVQPLVGAGTGRDRSMQASTVLNGVAAFGFETMFGWKPAPAHCVGSVSAASGTPTQSPATFCSMQGEFRPASVRPVVKYSPRNVCWNVPPILKL